MKKYDVIVVGAGTAGTLTAETTARSGHSTLIIDTKTREQIGNKVCGDVIGEHHFEELGLNIPNNGVLENKVKGIKVYSPDEETVFTIANQDFMGYMINRHLFGQWLLKKAIHAGAELLDSFRYVEPIIEKNKICGIVTRGNNGEKILIKSKVVVDASGYFGVVRNSLPHDMAFEGKLAPEDVELCYREVRQLENQIDNPDYCQIILNQVNTPGGYTWIFPKENGQVNTGLGVYMKRDYPNPREIFYKHVLTKPVFKNSKPIKMGGGFDPTRRPIDRLVGNGVMLTGDAASLVNPVHGGGIGPSMLSGRYAGDAIVEALEVGDTSEEGLWSYASKIMRSYGKKQASLDVFRRFLISTDDSDLNYGMRYKLLTEDDIYNAGVGEEFDSNISENARRVFRGLGKLRFLRRLRSTVRLMKQVRSHYEIYPETPGGFESWRQQTIQHINKARMLSTSD